MRDNSKDLPLKGTTFRSGDSSSRNTDWSRPGSIPASALPTMPSTAPRQTFAKYYNRFLLSPSDEAFFPRKPPIGRAAVPCPTSSRRFSTNASTVPIVTRYMPYSSPSSNSTPLSPLPSTPSPDATVLIGSLSRCESARSSRPGQESWATWTATTSAGIPSGHQAPLLPGGPHRRLHPSGLGRSGRRHQESSVMFAVLKSINFLNAEYGIQFEAILTDNGPEMASPRNTEGHPMERMLNELGIKHRYTRPYRPQTGR